MLANRLQDASPEGEGEGYSKETERERESKFIGRASQNEAAPDPKEKKSPVRGTRLSREWDLPTEWGKWAEERGMTPDQVILQCDKFKDHWISKPGNSATKVDWEATWRNWIRTSLEGFKR